MQFQYHANLTLGALRRWLIGQCYDSLVVSGLWLAAMFWLQVPWAPFWALLAGALQFIPHFGPLLSLAGPAMAMLYAGAPLVNWFGCWEPTRRLPRRWSFASAASDAPAESRALSGHQCSLRSCSASSFRSGVLFAAPLLAVIYAYRGAPKRKTPLPEQQFSSQDEGIVSLQTVRETHKTAWL